MNNSANQIFCLIIRWRFPDSSLILQHFQVFQTSGHPEKWNSGNVDVKCHFKPVCRHKWRRKREDITSTPVTLAASHLVSEVVSSVKYTVGLVCNHWISEVKCSTTIMSKLTVLQTHRIWINKSIDPPPLIHGGGGSSRNAWSSSLTGWYERWLCSKSL